MLNNKFLSRIFRRRLCRCSLDLYLRLLGGAGHGVGCVDLTSLEWELDLGRRVHIPIRQGVRC